MSEDIDNAANAAILMDIRVKEKIVDAMVEVMFAGSADGAAMVRSAASVTEDDMHFFSRQFMRALALEVIHSDAFKSNVNFLVANAIRDLMFTLERRHNPDPFGKV